MNNKAMYINLNNDQKNRVALLRESFSKIYDDIEEICKNSRESSLALTKLEEAQFWAIKGISREK